MSASSGTPNPAQAGPTDRMSRETQLRTVARIDVLPSLLALVCQTTSMGFAAIARVDDTAWTACAVHDSIDFGIAVGDEVDVNQTICKDVRDSQTPVLIDDVEADERYRDLVTRNAYLFRSYISVPIVLAGQEYFGNLCLAHPQPRLVATPQTQQLVAMVTQVIALHLESARTQEIQHAQLMQEQATGQWRERFVAVLGHDLRNPLHAIEACSQLLAFSSDERTLALSRRIQDNVARMSTLIDDSLDFAQAKLGGRFAVLRRSIDDLGARISAVVDELRDAHPSRRIDCRIAIDADVCCDPARVQQLCSNLLGNALVHGDQGPVGLSAQLLDGMLVIEVCNRGQPIPAAILEDMFKPFARYTVPQRSGGLGLGMYICSEIVRAHDGHLTVTSTVEDGTRVVAKLPAAA